MDLSAIEQNGAYNGTRNCTDIYDDINVVKRNKIERLRWLGQVAHMDSSNTLRKVFESEPSGGSHRKGRPRQRWAQQLNENVITLGI